MNVLGALSGKSPGPMLRALLGSRPPNERRALLEGLEVLRSAADLSPPELPEWAREPAAAAADVHGLSLELLHAAAWHLTAFRPHWSRETGELSGHGILAVPLVVLEGEQLTPADVVADAGAISLGDGRSRAALALAFHRGAAAIAAARARAGLVGAVAHYCEASGTPQGADTAERILSSSLLLAARRVPAGPLEAIAADLVP